MRNLATDLGNFQVGNTNTYIMAHHNIQDCNYWYEESIVKIPYPLGKSNKFRRFAKMFQNWIIMQFTMYQITPLLYLVRDEDIVLSNREIS